MRVIIAGSRDGVTLRDVIKAVGESSLEVSVVLSGTAGGADKLGESWASQNSVPVERYPARWNEEGKAAGFIRNSHMADNAEALIAVWDGESRGTAHMIAVAKNKGLEVFVYNLNEK